MFKDAEIVFKDVKLFNVNKICVPITPFFGDTMIWDVDISGNLFKNYSYRHTYFTCVKLFKVIKQFRSSTV